MTATDYIPIDTTLRGGPRLEPRSRGGLVLDRKARGELLDRRGGRGDEGRFLKEAAATALGNAALGVAAGAAAPLFRDAARSAGRPSDYPVATGYDRAYQQDSKGGDINDGRHGNFRNFLATDDVPETIFGIPVVQDESGYTEKDVAFFRENPKAAGFYEMGDEDWDGGAEPPDNGGGSPTAAGSGGSVHAADKAGPSEDIESDEEFLVQAQMARAMQTEGRGPDETGGLYLDLLATRNGAPAPRVTGHHGVTEIDGKPLDLDQDYTQDQMDAALLELARKAVLKQAPKLVGWGEASLASKFVGADGAYNAGDIHSKMPINEATYARLLSQARADLAQAQSRQTAADDLWFKYPDAQLREFLAMEERLAEQEKYDAHARLLQLSDESITNANSVASVNNKGLLTPRRTKTQRIADEIVGPGVNHGIAYSEILDSVKSAAPEATSRFRILSGYTSPGGRPVYVPVGQQATRERLDAAVRNGIIVQTVPRSAVRRPDRGRGVHQDDKGGR